MNSLQVQYFLSVAEHLSFTKAAQNLFTSQPSLSKQVAMLESELGVELFNRTKQYVHLTPAGAILYKELVQMTRQFNLVLEKAKQANLGIEGDLTIGCLEVLNTDFLSDVVKKFSLSYANISLSFERYGFKELRKKIINNELDIAFTISFELLNIPEIRRQNVLMSKTYIAISASHPLANKEYLSLEAFKDDCFLVTSDSPSGIDFVINHCTRNGFTPKKLIKSPTLESMVLNLELGLGVAIIDSSLRVFSNPNLRLIEMHGDDTVLYVNAVWKQDNLNPSLLLFINQLNQE